MQIEGREHMTTRRNLLSCCLAGGLALTTLGLPLAAPASAQAITNLEVFIPAAPGGGWDATGRAIEAAMREDGIMKEFKFEHAPGAGGMTGLPRFINGEKGNGNVSMVAGTVMVGGVEREDIE
jgi:putative tricarboxylic transport membrane protein